MDARVLIFRENDFPSVDGLSIRPESLIEALPPVESVRSVNVDELKKHLRPDKVDLLIQPYGSAFPKDAWPEILEYLSGGGNLLNLGGAPFRIPISAGSDGWHQEIPQAAYLRELMIHQVYEVGTSGVRSWHTPDTEPLLSGLVEQFSCDRVFELQVRCTSVDESPDEIGTTGCREAVLRPLLYALSPEDSSRRIAAPIIAIDRILGRFCGGRWVLANCSAPNPPRKEIIQRLAAFAALGAMDFQIRPSFACYFPDERASLTVHANQLGKPRKDDSARSLFLTVRKDNTQIKSENIEIKDFSSPYYSVIQLPIPITPGLYTVEARLSTGDPELTDKYASYCTTGFWCYDAPAVAMTQPLAAGTDYFMREKSPSPLIGTTYMASDVHRRFFLEPNPSVWERDFAEMKAEGVNVVRTGIWTGFRQVMPNPGAPNEGVMRALEAFLLTAAKHDITVILTLFAFTPEAWEGANPYLDPRSIAAQKEYVAAFARRFAKFNNVMYDLINEPSFPSGGERWTCLPNGDEYEVRAWREWVKSRHKEGSIEEKWRTTPAGGTKLPDSSDCRDLQTYEGSSPIRVLDYRLFAQEVFSRWVREMTAVIRQNGNPRQLITVGQDEGGAQDRPNPQFHGDDVDFTCTHTWWKNDDLLWDGLMAKLPDKVCLTEETGIMPTQNPDGLDRRSEEDCRNLLERKFVTAIASGSAGVIQWLWNTNVYMTTDSEVSIGFHRADLTRKPELDILRPMAVFLKEARSLLDDREQEEVCMVIPYSSMFSARDHATEATRRCIRVMHYECGVPMRVVSEYRLKEMGKPRMIVLPCARAFTEEAWTVLMKAVEDGATLLATGPIEWDEYWRPVDRLSAYELHSNTQPVAREEFAIIFGEEYRLTFGGEKVHSVDKAVIAGQSGFVKVENIGAGKLVYAPLPFELADNVEPTRALYQFALKQALVEPPFETDALGSGILIRPLVFRRSVLYGLVSETSTDKEFALTDRLTRRTLDVRLPAQRAALFLLGRPGGEVRAEYGGCVEKDASVPR